MHASRFEASHPAVSSMGERMPQDPRSNEEARSRNRRAEFTVTTGGDNLVLPGS